MAIVETVTANGLEVTFARKHVPESVAGMKTYEVDKVVMANAGDTKNVKPSAAISLFIGPLLIRYGTGTTGGTHGPAVAVGTEFASDVPRP
jgi:hypothetical protein